MSAATTLAVVRDTLAAGGEMIGTLLWWTLAEARVDAQTLEAFWTSARLPTEYLPDAPTSEKALKTAVRECGVGQHGRMIRLGKEDPGELVFAILGESCDGAGNVQAQQEARVVLDRVTGRISTDSPSHDLAVGITAAFEELRSTHTADDVRRAMLKVLDSCAAVTLREHGGVYWVPAPYSETVRRLQTAIEQIGKCRLYLLPVHKSDDAARTLGDVARLSIEQELEALKTEIQGFVAVPPGRSSTLIHRLEAFAALRAKASLYKQILEVQVTDLDQTLGALTTSVEQFLAQKRPA